MNRDGVIISGMLLVVIAATFACFRSRLVFTKLGFLVSAAMVCLGLAYFGWLPLFGGTHPPETLFGCLVLCLGLFGFCLFGAIEEIWRRVIGTPDGTRGFPVIALPPEEPAAVVNRSAPRG
jgi:hypothetical protein